MKQTVLKETSDQRVVVEPHSDCVETTDEAQRFVLPAQQWVRMANAYCGDRIAESDGKSVVGVPAVSHAGFLHAIFAVVYGGYSGEERAEGYRLVPPEMYEGETIASIDWRDARSMNTRRRGDSTGLLLKVKGKVMVCARRVHFIKTLPTTQPIALDEAQRFDEAARPWGWRAMGYRDADISWRAIAGHPVAIYRDPIRMRSLSMLFWRDGAAIKEYQLHPDLDTSMFEAVSTPQLQVSAIETGPPVQLGLF